jgi:hypothetical protein
MHALFNASPRFHARTALRASVLATLALGASLAAHADSTSDAALAKSYAADGLYAVQDFEQGMGYVSQAMALVGGSGVNKNVACPMGGSVTFTATPDALPVYTVAFQQCALLANVVVGGNVVKTTTNHVAVAPTMKNGWMASTTDDALNQFQAVTVSMPYGTLSLDGQSSSHSETTRNVLTKDTTSKVTHTIASPDAITLSTAHTFSERASAYALTAGTNVSYQTATAAGVTTGTTVSGQVLLTVYPYLLPQVGQIDQLNFKLLFNDSFSYDGNNVANSGNVTLVTPVNTAYKVTGASGQVSVCVDVLNDGTNEACFGPFPAASLDE